MKATLSHGFSTKAGTNRTSVGWTSGRVIAVVVGSILALCSLGLVGGGGYLLAEATSDGGWLSLGHGTYETESYAVVTEPQDWSTQTYLLGNVDKARIRVTPQDAEDDVFVGMARPEDVARYLDRVKHVTVHGASNYRVTYTQHEGRAPSNAPAESVPWTASVSGTGTQTLEFDAQEQGGDQVLVVMNADGSPAVHGKAESLVTQPSLPWIAAGLLVTGVLLAGVAIPLIVTPIRRVRATNRF